MAVAMRARSVLVMAYRRSRRRHHSSKGTPQLRPAEPSIVACPHLIGCRIVLGVIDVVVQVQLNCLMKKEATHLEKLQVEKVQMSINQMLRDIEGQAYVMFNLNCW
ncbi:hypothetical protein EJB05_38003, partial [Eragrostis curvula]